MHCLAVCAFAMEGIVKKELVALGFGDARCAQGCVYFTANMEGVFRANLWLRCCDRVLIILAEGKTETFEDLYQLANTCHPGEILPANAAFPVKGKCVRSRLMSVSDCKAITKKALADALQKKYHMRWCPEDGAVYQVECAIHQDNCRITLDTSGNPLNKRGYRTWNGEAPIRETLAAALLKLSPWRYSDPDAALADPCCGTGTFLIEAAFLQAGRAPGLKRSFAMEQWSGIGSEKYRPVRLEAEEMYHPENIHDLYGSDIDPEALKLCRMHIEQAGLKGRILVQQKDLRDLTLSVREEQEKKICFVCNPPYGERLGDRKQSEALYVQMRSLWDRHPGSAFTVITSSPAFERTFRKRAGKKYRFYNGRLECEYMIYPPLQQEDKR